MLSFVRHHDVARCLLIFVAWGLGLGCGFGFLVCGMVDTVLFSFSCV